MDLSTYKKLEFRRKFFRIFGAEIDITDPATEKLVGFIEVKAWKLREDVRIYSDKSKSKELLRIHARNVIDFSSTYDVFDSSSDKLLFSLRRKGLRSTFVRDHWDLLDASEQPIGDVQETSSGLALVRRYTDVIPFVGGFIDLAMSFWPLTYTISDSAGATAAQLTHQRNPLVVKFNLDQTGSTAKLDSLVSVVATALLAVVDAGKN